MRSAAGGGLPPVLASRLPPRCVAAGCSIAVLTVVAAAFVGMLGPLATAVCGLVFSLLVGIGGWLIIQLGWRRRGLRP